VSSSDTEWLNRAQHGDEEAFTHLVETYQTQVFNLCYRMLGDPAEAEDAAQECFWRAYQAIQKYDQSRSFITWLLSIAAHYCIDQMRKRRMMVLPMDILPEEEAPDPLPGPESHYNRREEQAQVHKLLESLGAQDRAAIIMRYWYDLSDEEIAEALSLTVSAVKSRLHRARKELAVLWQNNQASIARPERSYHEIPVF
jgi:RNA polymerase sigma-70 factor (ECF subfamily)